MEPLLSFFIRQTFFIILEVFMNNLVNQSTSLLPSFLCHLVLMISEGRAGIEFLYPYTYLLIEVRAPACFFFFFFFFQKGFYSEGILAPTFAVV